MRPARSSAVIVWYTLLRCATLAIWSLPRSLISVCIRYGCIGSSHTSDSTTIDNGVRGRAGALMAARTLPPRLDIMTSHTISIHIMTTPRELQRGHKGPAMEGVIASWYAKNTKGEARAMRETAERIAAELRPGARVLEVAPGPGYMTVELAKLGLKVSALDISHAFVGMTKANAAAAGFDVDARQGNASQNPFADASFDYVVCRAAFKNFADPLGAINEMHRVLVPGGQASILDLRKESSP